MPESRRGAAFAVRATTGILAAALAADATVFAMRALTAGKRAYVTKITAGFACTVAFTAGSQQLFVADRFTTATPTGGTAYTPHKKASGMAASVVTDARASTTAALTVTSVVFEGNRIPLLSMGSPAVASDRHVVHDFSDDPIVLATNEGLCIRNAIVWPAAGTGIFHGSVEWYER